MLVLSIPVAKDDYVSQLNNIFGRGSKHLLLVSFVVILLFVTTWPKGKAVGFLGVLLLFVFPCGYLFFRLKSSH